MKVIFNAQDLNAALDVAATTVDARLTIPVLGFVRLEAMPDMASVQLSTTNLDVTINVIVPAKVEQGGCVCVPFSKLKSIVPLLSKGAEVVLEGGKLTSERIKYKLLEIEPDRFAELPTFPRTGVSLPAKNLLEILQTTSFVIGDDESKYALAGLELSISKGICRAVATNGHVISVSEFASDLSEDFAHLLPRKAVRSLMKMLARSKDDDQVLFAANGNMLFFKTDQFTLAARKLTGKFPNWRGIVPEDKGNVTLIVNSANLRLAVQRVSVLSDDAAGAVRIKMSPAVSSMLVSCINSDAGEGEEQLDCVYSRDAELLLGFNRRYLLDSLNTLSGDLDIVLPERPNSPVLIYEQESEKPIRRVVGMALLTVS